MGRQLAEAPKFGSPWGKIQERARLADGVWFVSTASHGGVWLAPERRSQVPADVRDKNFLGSDEWWEEDCDAQRVLTALIIGLEDSSAKPARSGAESIRDLTLYGVAQELRVKLGEHAPLVWEER